MYSVVHTGANIQAGGLKEGLLIVVYQESTELAVKNEPKKPIIKGINMETKSLNMFFISSFILLID
jgi:hypothetical protein